MAEDPKEKGGNQSQPEPPQPDPKPAGKGVPQSSQIVQDNHAQSIRTLEEKLAGSEKTTQDLRKELGELQAIVKKANEVKTPLVTETPMTVLGYLEDLIFKKKQ